MIRTNKVTKIVTVVSAVALMTVGCAEEAEQLKAEVADKAAPSVVAAKQLASDVVEKAASMKPAADSVKETSSEPETMDDLLDGIEARIESDKPYVAVATKTSAKVEMAHKSGTYTVVSGDSLASIAKSHYGDSGKYMAIYEANKKILTSPNSLEVGQELTFPKL